MVIILFCDITNEDVLKSFVKIELSIGIIHASLCDILSILESLAVQEMG